MRYCCLFLLFFPLYIVAQPGGGGGLLIHHLYSPQLAPINIKDSTNLTLRIFLLNEQQQIKKEILLPRKNHRYQTEGIYFPSRSNIDMAPYRKLTSNQRLYLIYKKDTMIIDFIGIMGENGMGNIEKMDSLVVQKGHFVYYLSINGYRKRYTHEQYVANRNSIRNGFTPQSLAKLSKIGIIKQKVKLNLSFLLEENLPASYFVGQAHYHLQLQHTEAAFQNINRALEKREGQKNCEILFLLSDAYLQKAAYPKAIEFLSQALHCSRNRYEIKPRESNLRARAALYIKTGELDKALEDYNKMVLAAENPLEANIERAFFKMNLMKDGKGGMADLKKDIANIPANHMEGRPTGWSEYAYTYFNLGILQYQNEEIEEAFKNWLKAMEMGHGQTSDESLLVHFDSVIQQHPKSPMPYLTRAIVHYRRSPYLGGAEGTKTACTKALKDVEEAEALGLTGYRIPLYRAVILNELNRHEEALVAINLALQLQPNEPYCYIVKYDIRRELGQTIWGKKDDPDLLLLEKVLKEWKFEP